MSDIISETDLRSIAKSEAGLAVSLARGVFVCGARGALGFAGACSGVAVGVSIDVAVVLARASDSGLVRLAIVSLSRMPGRIGLDKRWRIAEALSGIVVLIGASSPTS